MSARNRHLGDLLALAEGDAQASLAVSKIASDSRKVEPGTLFFAVPGTKVDGMSFVPQAAAAGAVAIVGEAERPAAVATVDPEVLELYEELRPQKKGIGAAALVDGVCQGCHEQLSAVELSRVRCTDAIPRCEHCRRILVL